MRQYELIEKVKSYQKNADADALARAYVLASKVHHDQARESGEPYFYHPTSVAQILTEYKMDADTIVAALLHDTVEDTPTAYEDIENLFGLDVANLVEGVTKLSKIQLRDEDSKQAQNFQELVLATSKDIRILMIKMADRLHNMRTLSACKSMEKRQRISRETLQIYVPLAERIGLHKIKTEMEDLCFQNLYPEAYQNIVFQLKKLELKGHNHLATLIRQLKKILQDNHLHAEVVGRTKSPYSIWKKLQTHHNSIAEIFDLIGLRVLVKTIPDCYRALGIIHTHFHAIPGDRFKDYISNPKDSGYRSLHTCILGPKNQRLEIQIRTFEMNQESDFGVVAHWQYKQGYHPDAKQYQWMRELLELIHTSKTPQEFLEHTQLALYQDKIFIFSDRGRLYSLKQGATLLDFAYQVNVNTAQKCVGGWVNGYLRPMNEILHDGDRVKIKTGHVSPSKEWLNYITTATAKAHILSYLRQQKSMQINQQVIADIQKIANHYHVRFAADDLSRVQNVLHYKTLDSLLADVYANKITIPAVLKILNPGMKSTLFQKTVELFHRLSHQAADAPILGLTTDDQFVLANCCHPVVGESIVAIKQKEHQYVIHTRECSTLGQYKRSPSKWVAVEWNLSRKNHNPQPVRLQITWKTGPTTMGQVLSVFEKQKVDIVHMNTMAQNDQSTQVMADIQVRNDRHLKKFIEELKKHPRVLQVIREQGQ